MWKLQILEISFQVVFVTYDESCYNCNLVNIQTCESHGFLVAAGFWELQYSNKHRQWYVQQQSTNTNKWLAKIFRYTVFRNSEGQIAVQDAESKGRRFLHEFEAEHLVSFLINTKFNFAFYNDLILAGVYHIKLCALARGFESRARGQLLACYRQYAVSVVGQGHIY